MKRALYANSPMTNANPIITLRNNAIMWLSITVLTLVGTWWLYGVLSDAGSETLEKITKLDNVVTLIRDE